jgi:hypothetical protein
MQHNHPKSTFANIKILPNFSEITFLSIKNQKKCLANSVWETVNLAFSLVRKTPVPTNLDGVHYHKSYQYSLTSFTLAKPLPLLSQV